MRSMHNLRKSKQAFSWMMAAATSMSMSGSFTPASAESVQSRARVEGQQQPAAQFTYSEDGQLADELKMPLYTWSPVGAPKGVVLAIHGLVMHGKSFSGIAEKLADQGFIVIGTDLRGYGRCLNTDHRFCEGEDCKEKTNYDKSFDDLIQLSRALRERYPNLPLFDMGESLGGSLAVRIAATNPELVDAMILASPAVKPQSFIEPSVMVAVSPMVTNPRAQIDLTKYMSRCASNDPAVIAEMMAEPLVRKHLSFFELLQASSTVHKTIGYAPDVPEDMPVLIMQGSEDRCVKPECVMQLMSTMRSTDQTMRWFQKRGHILIETAYVQADTAQAILDWINNRVNSPNIIARRERYNALAQAGNKERDGLDSIGIVATIRAIRSRLTGHSLED